MLIFGLEKIGLRYGWKLRDEEGIIVRHNGIRSAGSLEGGGWWWNEGWGVSEFGVLGALENRTSPVCLLLLTHTDKVLWVGSVLRSRSPCPELHYCFCVVSFSFLRQKTREHYLKRRGLLSLRASEVLVYVALALWYVGLRRACPQGRDSPQLLLPGPTS